MNFNKVIANGYGMKDWLVNIRRDIHITPELAMEEFVTKEKIKVYLNEIGIPYKEYKDHRGIMAYIINENNRHTVAIRADIDALPIRENNNKSYKSKNEGVMHACGHDAHTTMLIGACKLLYEMKEELNVNVKFLFQGAEETYGGAEYLIKDGCLENPTVDYMFGLHVQPYLETGFIECKSQVFNASSNSIRIRIKGKRAHGAYPENGIDALVCAAQIITSLQSIISRNLSPTNMAVLTLGKIEGGEAQNVICEEVEIVGTIRALNKKSKDMIINRARDMIKNIAIAYKCEGRLIVEGNGYPELINHEDMVEVLKTNTKILLGEKSYIEKEVPAMGAEDFSFYTKNCKGVFFNLGCGNKEKGISSLIHTNEFDIDENCLPIGSLIHVLNVLYFNKKS
ncbi:MAG: M20 family metallopeptidase [Terrisporobacter sp.]|uniref:M20 metallopeptidase family protein n=1 Tax=Terrisporobacter sp. TaxID=1965305 RepID=UPI002FC75F14